MTAEADESAAAGWGTTEDVAETDFSGQQLVTIDAPEVKLFGKWSLQEVDVSDVSLVVCL
jgi:hypothetical protein